MTRIEISLDERKANILKRAEVVLGSKESAERFFLMPVNRRDSKTILESHHSHEGYDVLERYLDFYEGVKAGTQQRSDE
jgi:hypothetical protein